MLQRITRVATTSVCAITLGAALSLLAVAPLAIAAPSGPGFNDPQGLCKALIHLPTKGWHNSGSILGWGCISSLLEFGPSSSYGALPSTFQYVVTGDSYKHANKVKLFYNANNPASRTKSLSMMAFYAKSLSQNTAFHLSKHLLSKIKSGTQFTKHEHGATIRFRVNNGRIDVYKLIISASK